MGLILEKTINSKWQWSALSLVFLTILVALFTFEDYGVAWDDPIQHEYGRKILDYFSFGDKTALNFLNLHFYGGFFEFWMALIERVFQIEDIHTLRHLLIFFSGIVGCVALYRLAKLVSGSERAGFFAIAFLLLTPTFYGHMFINSKDIPFASGYVWSLYYLARLIKCPDKSLLPLSFGYVWSLYYLARLIKCPDKSLLPLSLKLGCAIGITMGIRIGGLILYCYLGLFLLAAVFYSLYRKDIKLGILLPRMVAAISVVLVTSYGIMLMFWPWGQWKAFTNPFISLAEMSSFKWQGEILYKGSFVSSTNLPWDYLPHLFLIQMPEAFSILIGVGVFFALKNLHKLRDAEWLGYGVVIFAAIFPVIYVIVTKATLYDNTRHLLFVFPCFAAMAGFALNEVFAVLERRAKVAKQVLILGIFTYFAYLGTILVGLHPVQYAYYNNYVSGVAKASKSYEADYWGISLRKTVESLESKIKQDHYSNRPVKVSASPPYFTVMQYANSSPYLEYVKLPKDATFHISTTRLNQHHAMQGKTVLEFKRRGATFAVVKKLDHKTLQIYD